MGACLRKWLLGLTPGGLHSPTEVPQTIQTETAMPLPGSQHVLPWWPQTSPLFGHFQVSSLWGDALTTCTRRVPSLVSAEQHPDYPMRLRSTAPGIPEIARSARRTPEPKSAEICRKRAIQTWLWVKNRYPKWLALVNGTPY